MNIKKERQKIILNDHELIEKFVKGSGPGGQCVNKRVSCVDLRHIPTGIRVQCQQTRSLEQNRGIARKLLKDKLDDLINGDLSKHAQKAAKVNKAKARKARRAKKKYGSKEEEQIDTKDDV
ncbi:peptide chain release factor class I/class II [Circinella umbellata]|nr:peptide chain release factor class I/class II [Circinella umbellata]